MKMGAAYHLSCGQIAIVFVCLAVCLPHRLLADELQASLGNSIGAAGVSVFDRWHKEGLSLTSFPSRTPSGFLYGKPHTQPLSSQEHKGWQTSGSLEAGIFAPSGDNKSAAFNEYSDWGKGFLVSQFALNGYKPDTGDTVSFRGGSPGRDDQYYQLQYLRPGQFSITGQFQSLRHIFTSKAQALWTGVGSDYLRLAMPLKVGVGDKAAITQALNSVEPSRLSLTRDKGAIKGEIILNKQLKLLASISHEWREGTRPFGVGFSYPTLGQIIEAVEPIDYQTTNFQLEAHYAAPKMTANVMYKGSIFDNNTPSLTFENPGLGAFTDSFVAREGRFALAPSNHYHLFAADVAAPLAFWSGRLSVIARYSIARQDEDLLPPTISSGTLAVPGQLLNFDDWNSVSALSQPSADLDLRRLTLIANLLLSPSRRWRVALKLRYDDETNSSGYTAFNPLTGSYGYIAMDGGLGATMPRLSGVFNATFNNRLRYRSIPYTKDKTHITAEVSRRFSSKSKLRVTAAYKAEKRHPREVEETQDFILGASFSAKIFRYGNARLSYEFTERDGTDYIPAPYEAYYTSSLPDVTAILPSETPPPTLSEFRKFDVAVSQMHRVKVKLNWLLSDTIDLATTALFTWKDFRADFGLKDSSVRRVNAEFTWYPNATTSFYTFASFDHDNRSVANVNDSGALDSDGSFGGPIYPVENAWTARAKERGFSIGSGIKLQRQRWMLDINYVYAKNTSKLQHTAASARAFSSGVLADEAGTSLPDQTFRLHSLTSSLSWLFQDNLQIRFLYRLESERLRDYHYDGLTSPIIGNDIYLGVVPENYTNHILGVFFGARF